jgi:acyl carrier protein
MTREDIVSYIRAHLADELELDPARVEEGTRFKEDLEADSLDLYSLVQELEDIYGVRMSDEQAARIRTVGQAVDFVISETSTKSPGGESSADGEASGRGGMSSPGDETSDPGAPAGEDTATGTTANREPGP